MRHILPCLGAWGRETTLGIYEFNYIVSRMFRNRMRFPPFFSRFGRALGAGDGEDSVMPLDVVDRQVRQG